MRDKAYTEARTYLQTCTDMHTLVKEEKGMAELEQVPSAPVSGTGEGLSVFMDYISICGIDGRVQSGLGNTFFLVWISVAACRT